MTKAPMDLEKLKQDIRLLKSVTEDNISGPFHPNDFPVLVKQGADLIERLEEAKKLAIKCDDYGCRYETDWFEWLNRFKKKEGEK